MTERRLTNDPACPGAVPAVSRQQSSSPYRDNATLKAPFFVDPHSPNPHEQIARVILEICPEILCQAAPSPSSAYPIDSVDGDSRLKLSTTDTAAISTMGTAAPACSDTLCQAASFPRPNHPVASINPAEDDSPLKIAPKKSAATTTMRSSLSASSMSSIDISDPLSVKELGGGLSNHLYVVSLPDPADNTMSDDDECGGEDQSTPTRHREFKSLSVLVRVHVEDGSEDKDGGASFVDREAENRVMAWLSRLGSAPAYYGRFLNGRVEEFYASTRPLDWSEMGDPRYARPIARAMADLHRQNVPPGILREAEADDDKAEIWDRIDRWLELARDAVKDHHAGNQVLDEDVDETISGEWGWLKRELLPRKELTKGNDAVGFSRSVVFTHMDCQSLNILVDEDPPRSEKGREDASIRLIDFEYAGFNPRAADIANTFCEHCNMNNLRADYARQYPTTKQQDTFLRCYVEKADPDLAQRLTDSIEWDPFLTSLRNDVGKHTLLSHLGWALWSVVQSQLSSIEYDYRSYARQRMKGYWYFKKRFFLR